MAEWSAPADAVRDALLVTSAEGRVERANAAARALVGRDPTGEALDVVLDAPAHELTAMLREFLRSTSPTPGGAHVLRDDGVTDVRVTGRRLVGDPPQVLVRFDARPTDGFAALTEAVHQRDAELARRRTAEKQLAQVLSTTVAELVQANAALRRFSTMAAHDLRGPLVTAEGYARLLARQVVGDETTGDWTARLLDTLTKGQQLVGELLAEARVGSGSDSEVVDLERSVRWVRAVLAADLATHRLTTGTLPRVASRPVVVRQVLLNLVGNSLRHGGGGPVHVHVDTTRDDDHWAVQVSDDGPGIPPSDREAVLERGVRDLGAGGSGLGLHHCRVMLEGHGQRLWLEDSPLGGLAACFTLPAVDDTQAQQADTRTDGLDDDCTV